MKGPLNAGPPGLKSLIGDVPYILSQGGGVVPLAAFDQLDGDWLGGDLARRNLWQYTEDVASSRYSVQSATKQADTYTIQANGAPVVLTRVTAANFYSSLRSPVGGLGLAPFTVGKRYLVSCFIYTPDAIETFLFQRALVNGGSPGYGGRYLTKRARRIWYVAQATSTSALDPGPAPATDLGGSAGTDPYWFVKGSGYVTPVSVEIYVGGFQIELLPDGYDDGIAALGSSIYQVDSGGNDAQASSSPLRFLEGLLNVTVFNRGVAGNKGGDMPPLRCRCASCSAALQVWHV